MDSSGVQSAPAGVALLPGYDTAHGSVSQAEQSKVQGAADQIHQLVSGDQGTLGTSRNGHMQQVQSILQNLSPAERDAVVSKLSDGDLKAMTSGIDHGGVFGAQGLSAGQKTDLLNTFASMIGFP